jgi:hypothetical protein
MGMGVLMIWVSSDQIGIENSALAVGRNGKIGFIGWAEIAGLRGADRLVNKNGFITN